LKWTFFKPFVPDAKTRPVPEKYLAFVASLVEVYEQMAAERIMTHKVICEHRKLIKPATHISRLGVYEYSYGWWKSQHKPALHKTEITSLNVLLSAVELIRKMLPEESTSSKAAWPLLGIATSMNADDLESVCLFRCELRPESLFRQL
jgi:hypothetical protein